MRILVLHLTISLVWFLLSTERQLLALITGWIITYPLLYMIRDFIGAGSYLRRSWNFILFLLSFAIDFIKANIEVIQLVWFSNPNRLNSGFADVNVGELSTIEVLLLSQCITLTPGTSTILVKRNENSYILTIHYLNAESVKEVQKEVIDDLLQKILNFTRP